MSLLRIHIISFLFICVIVNAASTETKPTKNVSILSASDRRRKNSQIHRIKALDSSEVDITINPKPYRRFHAKSNHQSEHKQTHHKIKQQQQKHYDKHHDLLDKTKLSDGKKSPHISNKQLLSNLGLTKMKIPSSHSRKRLAVESRHHARPDDSHMFVIKLPPNPYYYSNSKPVNSAMTKNSIADDTKSNKNSNNNNKKVSSFSFQSNGKPGKIYHWNLPALKKIIASASTTSSLSSSTAGRDSYSRRNDRVSNLIDIKNTPTWSKPWENETIEKAYRVGGDGNDDPNFEFKKKKSPTYYYAPVKQKKNSFHKYFPGNGKPQGLYVIKKNHKSGYYQKLIP